MSTRDGGLCLYCCLWLLYNILLCLILAAMFYVYEPQQPKFTVTNASLTKFNFTNTNNTLYYNLALNITIRNPNKRVGIHYLDIQVSASYRKKMFALVNLTTPPLYQGHKNTTILHHVLVEGQQLVVFGETDISQFNWETGAGVYSIDVQLALRVRAKYATFTSGQYNSDKINCKLKVPLSFDETSASGFNATKCGNVYVFL